MKHGPRTGVLLHHDGVVHGPGFNPLGGLYGGNMKTRSEYKAIVDRWRALPPGRGDVSEMRVDEVSHGMVPFMTATLRRTCAVADVAGVGALMSKEMSESAAWMSAHQSADGARAFFEVSVHRPLDTEDNPNFDCDEVAAAAGVGGTP